MAGIKVGDKFGHWEVLDGLNSIEGKKNYFQLCLCTKCKVTKSLLTEHNLLKGNTTQCVNCYQLSRSIMREGFSKEESVYFNRVKYSAKERKIPFNLTIEETYELLKKQNYKCAVSGKMLTVGATASIDRKDSSKSYSKRNIQWVHKDINKMKSNLTQEYFFNLCEEILNYQILKKK